NLPFREPLVPTGAPLVDAPGRADDDPFVTTMRAHADVTRAAQMLASLVPSVDHGVIVAGFDARVDRVVLEQFATATGWPVLADAVSNARGGSHVVSTYEALLRSDAFTARAQPQLALRIGAPLTSKVANAWLHGIPAVIVDEHDGWLDPDRVAAHRIVAD